MEVVVKALYSPPIIGVQVETWMQSDIRKEMYRRIINLEDQVIREQLIKLGWTPPAEDFPRPPL